MGINLEAITRRLLDEGVLVGYFSTPIGSVRVVPAHHLFDKNKRIIRHQPISNMGVIKC
jgi:hypothetical protein